MIPLVGPALVIAIAGLFWWLSPDRSHSPPVALAPESGGWSAVNFDSLAPGQMVPGWDVVRGAFAIVEKDGRKFIEMQPEPMVEGNLTCGQLLARGGGIRARMQGERIRRAAPRFAVSLNGDSEIILRVVAASGIVQICTVTEQVLASAPWRWNPGTPVWLELTMIADASGGAAFEGRTWTEGDPRPEKPTVTCRINQTPGIVRPAIRGAPYALRPIQIDRIEILRSGH